MVSASAPAASRGEGIRASVSSCSPAARAAAAAGEPAAASCTVMPAPSPSETLAGDEGDGIEARLTHHQEVAVLRDAIMGLKAQERTVLALYYFEELKLHEIAKVLELTESRVSQIRSKAIERLRTQLAPMRGQLARAG